MNEILKIFRIVDLDSGVCRSVSSVYMRLITQSPHDESTPTAITFRGDGSLVVKTNRPKKKPKETCIYDVHSMLGTQKADNR